MNRSKYNPEQFQIAAYLARWTALVFPVSVAIGLIVALFLWLLDLATKTRWDHTWLIFILPIAGVAITYIYQQYGKNSEGGNNLIMEEIHKPGGGVPTRMTPLILLSTVATHLFGGSAGREGTAVQMGGSLSSLFAKWYKLKHEEKRILLMCGMSAGFGAVFGTPIAGCIFALEVLTVGRIKYDALMPCLIASIIAHFTCMATGIHHQAYHIHVLGEQTQLLSFLHIDILLLLKVIAAGAAFGVVSYLFAEFSHFLKEIFTKYIKIKWLIPVVGGLMVIGICLALGTYDYIGLGVTSPDPHGVSIVSAFTLGGATNYSWLWKLLLTAITLSAGFKGGEVTPLFFIGATLGNVLAVLSGAPVDLFAALGFIAVFAGATNTPLACMVMGAELFGGENILYYAIACFTAYYFSGRSGIYHAQRREMSKYELAQDEELEDNL